MNADWRALSRKAGFRIESGSIRVRLRDHRGQLVNVEQADVESLRLWSVVARPAAVQALAEPEHAAWNRNRLSEFVGFSVDKKGRMIGEQWMPIVGLTATEWKFAVYNLALACDRFEYLLTGSDEE